METNNESQYISQPLAEDVNQYALSPSAPCKACAEKAYIAHQPRFRSNIEFRYEGTTPLPFEAVKTLVEFAKTLDINFTSFNSYGYN